MIDMIGLEFLESVKPRLFFLFFLFLFVGGLSWARDSSVVVAVRVGCLDVEGFEVSIRAIPCRHDVLAYNINSSKTIEKNSMKSV